MDLSTRMGVYPELDKLAILRGNMMIKKTPYEVCKNKVAHYGLASFAFGYTV
jgi:hypothetical protein